MSKAQLIRALAELNVPESEYQHLSKNAELEALLKQKKAERAMKDAEASTDDSEAESEAVAAGGSSDSSPADTSEADAGETDDEPEIGVEDAPANLTKLRARTGFEVRVIDCAIVDGRRLGQGETLKVSAGKSFHAGDKTCAHLIEYRAADRT